MFLSSSKAAEVLSQGFEMKMDPKKYSDQIWNLGGCILGSDNEAWVFVPTNRVIRDLKEVVLDRSIVSKSAPLIYCPIAVRVGGFPQRSRCVRALIQMYPRAEFVYAWRDKYNKDLSVARIQCLTQDPERQLARV